MSLREIKDELESLCTDIQFELVDDYMDRVAYIKKLAIHSNQWIEKTAHLRLKICNCLSWDGINPNKSFEDIRWMANVADGVMEEAIRIDTEARLKGIPKPLKSGGLRQDPMDDWMDACNLNESTIDFVSSKDLHEEYLGWMYNNEPNEEPLNIKAFGARLNQDGFERTTKRVDSNPVKGWKVSLTGY